jgi:hypothetical protein
MQEAIAYSMVIMALGLVLSGIGWRASGEENQFLGVPG